MLLALVLASGMPMMSRTVSAEEAETYVSVEQPLPLCEEKTTISIWVPMSSNIANQVDNIGQTAFFKELEERTNVHVEFQHPSTGGEAQAFNLMINSGVLPDMIVTSDTYPYPGGLDQAVEDGYYLDLTDLIPEYCPNYLSAMTHYASQLDDGDIFLKSCTTEEGRYVSISQMFTEPQGDFAGWYMRKDWLDDLGLGVPVTFDDWETALKGFKEEKGATAPMQLYNQGYDFFGNLPGGFDVGTGFYQVDGQVKFGPMEENWKEYVTLLHRWYEDGLIDPDYMSGSFWPDQAMIVTGKSGCFFSMYTLIAMYENGNEDENAEYIPVTAPVRQEGDTVKFGTAHVVPAGTVISADSENAELCLRWLNYLFSEEGSIFANYGIEGDTFEYVDGRPQYTEKVTANEQYSFSEAMSYYTMPPSYVASLQDWTRELAAVPAKDIVSYDIWPQNKTTEYSLPTVTKFLNADEATRYAKINNDLTTLANEATAGFITGTKDIDSEWDSYVESLKKAGVEELIELIQEAYERFISK